MYKFGILAPLFFLASLTLAHAHSEPRTVAGCFGDYTYYVPPERVISLDQQATDLMIALELEDHLVGTAHGDPIEMPLGQAVSETVPILSEGYPGRKAVLALEPDFLIGSKLEAFADTQLGAGADWQDEQDVGVYLLDGSCQAFHEDGQPKSFEPLLKDIQILGDIFHIKGRAAALLRDSLMRLKAVQKAAAGEGRTAFVFSGDPQAPQSNACCNGIGVMLDLVGLKSIDIAEPIEWAAVAAADPDVIILVDEASFRAEAKRAYLQKDAVLSKLKAVQDNRIVALTALQMSLGLRFVGGAERLNAQLLSLQ
ncbi:ABC transporter substrate-binding protein [uncultured Cohaesibacter sp.]|uniref:ABC transporter substrate-binding protein n=1 Tax=uncultured Cohaesibacter sp. TaxID=1002546 RepID=UPI002AA67BA2|nr:ABC transporter substrate-binding protein [uncultured Cohaesibacter sp.]